MNSFTLIHTSPRSYPSCCHLRPCTSFSVESIHPSTLVSASCIEATSDESGGDKDEGGAEGGGMGGGWLLTAFGGDG